MLRRWAAVVFAAGSAASPIMSADEANAVGGLVYASEAALLRRVALEDMEALSELFRRYQPRFLDSGKRRYCPPLYFGEVEDSCSEAFAMIYRRATQFRGNPTSPDADRNMASAWLWKIFYDMCQRTIDKNNAEKRGGGKVFPIAALLAQVVRADLDDDSAIALISYDIPNTLSASSPQSTHVDRALVDSLKRAVAALKPPLRRAIALRFWRDLPFSQVAEREGTRVNTVTLRCMRAVAALRAALKKDKVL